MLKFFSSDPDKLLKKATNKKKTGDIIAAIENLRKAYKIIGKNWINYGFETFLRLPMYLQEAGKNDEAWKEFNNLIIKVKNDFIALNKIYDKMRLFLQREGKNIEAIKFSVFSYYSWVIELYKRHEEAKSTNEEYRAWEPEEVGIQLKNFTTRENITTNIQKVIKKASKKNITSQIVSIIEEQVEILPKIDFIELGKKLDKIVIS